MIWTWFYAELCCVRRPYEAIEGVLGIWTLLFSPSFAWHYFDSYIETCHLVQTGEITALLNQMVSLEVGSTV